MAVAFAAAAVLAAGRPSAQAPSSPENDDTRVPGATRTTVKPEAVR